MTEFKTSEVNGYMHADIRMSEKDWLALLLDPATPKYYVDTLLKFYYEPGHEASCKKVSDDYGVAIHSVNANIWHLGQYVQGNRDFSIVDADGNRTFWLTLMDGKQDGDLFLYRVKTELCEAIKEWLYIYMEQAYKKYRRDVPIKGEYNGSKWDELYKWQLITSCQGKTELEQANLWKKTNLYDTQRDSTVVKNLIANQSAAYSSILRSLYDENVKLEKRLADFRNSMLGIVNGKLSSKANDERTASTILTCHNPQIYTFYKNDVYENFCEYLGVEPETRVNYKYPHFLELLKPLKERIAGDSELKDLVSPYLKGQLQSDLLLAQDVCWCLMRMHKGYLALPPKKKEKEKLWIVNVKYQGGVDGFREKEYIGMGDTAPNLPYSKYKQLSKLRKDFLNATGKQDSPIPLAYWQLMREVKQGDVVVAVEARNDNDGNCCWLLGWGIMDGKCYYTGEEYPIRMNVKWHTPAPIAPIKDTDLKKSLFFYKEDKQKTVNHIKQLLNIDISSNMEDYSKYIELLDSNHNLILTGAPGTGKTYLAKHIAAAMIGCEPNDKELYKSGRFEFVQFHPSYDYTDFVEGLRPVQTEGGQIGFERKDGVFKAFCEKALPAQEEGKPFVFVIDEINRGEISKIFGELFFSIDPGYRGEEGAVRTQYANLQTTPNVFDTALDSGTYGHIFVPRNVYIIGTMNDIDRSVESMDFAMRRRFVWEEVTAEESMNRMLTQGNKKLDGIDSDTLNELRNRMKNLNDAIIGQYGNGGNVARSLHLGPAYQIGASYFLKFADYYAGDKEAAFSKLWNNHIKNVLSEYLRGNTDAEEQLEYLKSAYNDGEAHVEKVQGDE